MVLFKMSFCRLIVVIIMTKKPLEKIRVIFMGSPDAAVKVLAALNEDERIEVPLVITKPDKPRGRAQKVIIAKIKQYALDHGIKVFQPDLINIEESLAYVDTFDSDLIFLIGYGKILGQELLNLPRYGCINLHGALLPKYRGPAPIQASILHGDTETGITYMAMDEGLDTGDIIDQVKIKIKKNETADELQLRLANLVAKSVAQVIVDYVSGKLIAKPQDKSQATYCHILNRDDGKIDWTEDAKSIHDKIRAYTSWPGAFTYLDGHRLKILQAEPHQQMAKQKPGVFFLKDDKEPAVACGSGYLSLKKLQLEGKKAISGEEFARGYGRLALTRCR